MSLKIDRLQLDIVINNDQARKSLRELEDHSIQLQKQMAKVPKGSEEWNKMNTRLKELKVQHDKVIESIGIQNLTMKELASRQRELNAILLNMRPGMKGYEDLKKQQIEVGQRLKELKVGAQQTSFSLKGMADGFNRYFATATAGVASLTGLVIGLRKAVETFNEFEKRVSNLSALTGLTGDNLKWLSEQAKELSTSTIEGNIRITSSATEIVDAYTKVGSKRPELLKVKEDLNAVTQEAMILAAAANGELQPAVDGLTMVLNQFNAPASESRRIINVLAAGSKEGAGEIDYLTAGFEKAGSVASSFGISIEELTGVLETLAPRISEPEMAGRSLRNIMIKLESQSNDNLKPSIVGLGNAFEYMREKQYSVVQLTDLFGQENINAANILMNNTAEIEKYTKAVTGTTVALEQATINTNNNADALQQARNRVELLTIEFGEKLAPAMTFSTNAFGYFMKAMLAAPEFIRKNEVLLISLAGALLAYNAALLKSTAISVFNHLTLQAGIGLKIKDAVVLQALIIKEGLFTAAKTQGTIATKAAAVAQYLWNTAMSLNPIGAVIAGITALVVAIKLWDSHNAGAIERQNQINEALKNAETFQTELNKSIDEYGKSLTNLNSLSVTEKNDLREKIRLRIEHVKAMLLEMQAQAETVKKENTRTTVWQDVKNALLSAGNGAVMMGRTMEDALENSAEAVDPLNEKIKGVEAQLLQLQGTAGKLDDILMAESIGDAIGIGSIAELEEKIKNYNIALKNVNKDSEDYVRISKKLADANKLLGTGSVLGSGSSDADKKTHEKLLADKKKAQEDYYNDVAKLADDNFKKSLSKDEQELLAIDEKYQALYAKADLAGQDTAALQQQHADELSAKQLEIEERTQQAIIELKQKYGIDVTAEVMGLELAQLYDMYDKKLITEEQFQQAKQAIIDKYNKKDLKAEKQAAKDAVQIEKWKQEGKMAVVEATSNLVQTIFKSESIAARIAASAMAIINTWAAATAALAPPPVGAGPIAGIPLATAAVINGLANVARINAVQFASGKYDVIGASDGKTYSANYAPTAKTGIYQAPTLIGDGAPELVVDGPTLRNMQMNAPGLIQAILQMRVPQYAGGNYQPAHVVGQTVGSNAQQSQMESLILYNVLKEISEKLDKPTRAAIVYSDLDKSIKEVETIKNSVRK